MNTLPLRQLAIRLACIQPADRAWILERLDPREREQMDALLMEVAGLGLDKDPAVLAAIARESLLHPARSWSGCSQEHPFWRSLSGHELPQALAAALTSRLAVMEVTHAKP